MNLRRGQMPRVRPRVTAVVGALMALSLLVVPATATHSWGSYHWARTSNPFTLKVGDNVTPAWDVYLDESVGNPNTNMTGDWNRSTVIRLTRVAGQTEPRKCRPVAGTIQVCNYAYGTNGWLGLAQIWISGGHITQGTAKMNDSYYTMARYNTPAERRLVMCQEIAHAFGLDHQDENHGNTNLGSCMDYTNAAGGGLYGGFNYGPSNEWANGHDFDQLGTMYNHHLDSNTTAAATVAAAPAAGSEVENDPSSWGEPIDHHGHGRPSHYEKDLGGGKKVLTFVIWAEEEPGSTGGDGTADGGHAHEGAGHGGHAHEGTVGNGTVDDGTGNDGTGDTGQHASGKQDGGKKADSKRDGGKKRDAGKRGGKKSDSKRDGKRHR